MNAPFKPLKRRIKRAVISAILIALSLFYIHAALWRAAPLAGDAPQDGYTRVQGAVHMHTIHSDGGGTPAEVTAAAQAAGLQFIIITDHNNLNAKSAEGYHDNVLTLVGTELSSQNGHIVAFGIPDPVFRFSGDARDAFDDVNFLGGYAYVAHPLRSGGEDLLAFDAWDLPGGWGIEIMNGKSQLTAASLWQKALLLARYPVNPDLALLTAVTPPTAELAKWDEILSVRNANAFFGSDAHNRIPYRKRTLLRFPAYRHVIGLTRCHVLLDRPLTRNADEDGRAVISALARGRSYMAIDALAAANDFSFTALDGVRRYTMGETVLSGANIRLQAGGRMPRGTRLTLLRNGRVATEAVERLTAGPVESGVYRVEARLRGSDLPWIVSNPIYVMDAQEAAARAARAAWPAAVDAAPATTMIDDFEGRTAFALEFDSSSKMEASLLNAKGGIDGRGAAHLAFALGRPAPPQTNSWCALVDRTSRDLTGETGIAFAIKADRAYRLWVQVRDENPASADQGTEWWFASIRTSPEWRRVRIPFARLRSINKKTDGRLDLAQVRGLVFLIDQAADQPGTAGDVWIDQVGTYRD
ncbi:MAG: CehA/McbA family metallohydrolase [Vicinamibacteria bacterium]|jgi:hypothetical protein|nr:CehA/McbA family metallohydrolase [Vicinamibacteria bacterium]